MALRLSTTSVRPLWPDDSVEEITHLLHRAYLRNANAGLRFVASHQSVEVTAERLAEGETLIAERDGRIVGTITLHLPQAQPYGDYAPGGPICSFSQFAVDPSLAGEGVGDQLLASAEARASAARYTKIALDTAQGATGLIAYYRSRGYEIVARADWRPKTNHESWILAKELKPCGP